jgi:hypothetical protein
MLPAVDNYNEFTLSILNSFKHSHYLFLWYADYLFWKRNPHLIASDIFEEVGYKMFRVYCSKTKVRYYPS